MAIVANTFTRYSAIGIREDLSNVIYNISPEETPFISNIGRENVKNTYFEWQTDSLAAASASNAALEGDDVSSFTAVNPTSRVGNYTQISTKNVVISGTLEALDKAGRRSELTYQLAKLGSELKRDMESALLANQSPVAGNTTTARRTAGLPAWLKTNVNKASDGTNNRFQRARDAFVVDPDYASMAILRPIQQMELAKTGDAEKRLMLVEYGLKVSNEAAHGIVADLTTA